MLNMLLGSNALGPWPLGDVADGGGEGLEGGGDGRWKPSWRTWGLYVLEEEGKKDMMGAEWERGCVFVGRSTNENKQREYVDIPSEVQSSAREGAIQWQPSLADEVAGRELERRGRRARRVLGHPMYSRPYPLSGSPVPLQDRPSARELGSDPPQSILQGTPSQTSALPFPSFPIPSLLPFPTPLTPFPLPPAPSSPLSPFSPSSPYTNSIHTRFVHPPFPHPHTPAPDLTQRPRKCKFML